MTLHRDIYWVGRQWAVTGYGVQAVDQKQKGKFDIEASRLWEDDLLESIRAERWLNLDDFERALAEQRPARDQLFRRGGERGPAGGNCSGLEGNKPGRKSEPATDSGGSGIRYAD